MRVLEISSAVEPAPYDPAGGGCLMSRCTCFPSSSGKHGFPKNTSAPASSALR